MPKSGQPWDPAFLAGHPLFRPFEPFAAELRGSAWPSLDALSAFIERYRTELAPEERPLRFRTSPKKPRRSRRAELEMSDLYDGSIALRGEVLCLDASYHDLFNALIFASFPRSKRALHARQFKAQQAWLALAQTSPSRLPGQRSRQQDALTIFDEGGIVLGMAPAFREEWVQRGEALSFKPQEIPEGIAIVLFGHAVLEHLHEGQVAVRASAVVSTVSPNSLAAIGASTASLAELDRRLAERLADPAQFCEPGADAIFELRGDGALWISAPKPSWTEWAPPIPR